jgi:threonine dehydrogenase-like Zn-dependent dehydrogenase
MIFQRERLEDLLMGHNWRLFAARGLGRGAAMEEAVQEGFSRIVIYGLGSTGLLGTIAIRERYPNARVVAVARSEPGNAKHAFLMDLYPDLLYVPASDDLADTAQRVMRALGGKPRIFIGASATAGEAEVAFGHGVLDNNGIYASFSLGPTVGYDSMPFGFRNHLIFGAINFRRDHMEEAIELLCRVPLDRLCREYPLAELARDPAASYNEVYRSAGRAFKSVTVWDEERIS